MSTISDEYFFIRKPDNVRLPLLEPDSITEDRRFCFEQQPVGSPPLVFNNAWKDHNRSAKISGITPDILFAGADLVVRTAIRERLLDYSIPSLHMHPVVYIDNQGKWHEDFWYLAFPIDLTAGTDLRPNMIRRDRLFDQVDLNCMKFFHINLMKIYLLKSAR